VETVEETYDVMIKTEKIAHGGSGNWFFLVVLRIKLPSCMSSGYREQPNHKIYAC
jgi:hypothetical protein